VWQLLEARKPWLESLLTQRLPAGSEWRVEPRSSAHHLGSW